MSALVRAGVSGLHYCEPKPEERREYRLISHLRVASHRLRESRLIDLYREQVEAVNGRESWASQLDDSGIDSALLRFRARARSDRLFREDREVLYQALAVLRELSTRELGQRPYDVQILCVLAMVDCQLVQLAPGEGKTLGLGLVSILFAWCGKPCHVVTANEYLARRDVTELQPLFRRCQLTSCYLDSGTQQSRTTEYAANIVYGTSNQFLADYLKDNLAAGETTVNRLSLTLGYLQGKTSTTLKMRGLHSVIIDEADSILIDDATTPLIISGPHPDPQLQRGILAAKGIVDHLQSGRDYWIDSIHRDVKYTAEGEQRLELLLDALPPLWQHPDRRREILQQAIQARDVFLQDHHYIIEDEKIVIVDESTGRLMSGRSWSNGLHQAVEARAGVPLTDPNKILARMSFQNYFKLYHRMAGASGTLHNIQTEIYFNYRIHTLRIPQRLPTRRVIHPYRAFSSGEEKWQAVVAEIMGYHNRGIPVLVGTRNIEDSERLDQMLRRSGVACEILNAKNHKKEAEVIARAGLLSSITVATNMAGRGTDIKVDKEVIDNGGLVVLMLEPHESTRVDWQLFGRTGRQGSPGEVLPMAACDDELLMKHLPRWLRPLNTFLAMGFINNDLMTFLISSAQKNAEKRAFRQRQRLNAFDRKTREMMSFIRTSM